MDDFYINDEVEALRRAIGRNSRFIFANDAIIEEIVNDNRTSFVTISYGVRGNFNMINMELVTLVVSRDTMIRNCRGQRISAWDLRAGMVVDAQFSSAMTRSIPPQSRAYRITVVRENVNPYPNPNFPNVVEDRVMEVDTRNNFLITGNPNDMMSQMRFVVNNETQIFDRRGNRISLRNLSPGQMVRVEHADFMTMSIPPQTTAFRIWVI